MKTKEKRLPKHGTRARYQAGCRCNKCTEANTEYQRTRATGTEKRSSRNGPRSGRLLRGPVRLEDLRNAINTLLRFVKGKNLTFSTKRTGEITEYFVALSTLRRAGEQFRSSRIGMLDQIPNLMRFAEAAEKALMGRD